jgi:hypothetical protein
VELADPRGCVQPCSSSACVLRARSSTHHGLAWACRDGALGAGARTRESCTPHAARERPLPRTREPCSCKYAARRAPHAGTNVVIIGGAIAGGALLIIVVSVPCVLYFSCVVFMSVCCTSWAQRS